MTSDPSPSLGQQTAWGVFFSTFITILLAEFGDKTQLAIILMSAEFKHPIPIILGSVFALVITSLLGVLAGRWLAQYISPKLLHRLGGITLVGIALFLLGEVLL